MTGSVLRPEGRPIPYWHHQKRAKEVLNRIIDVLKAAADSVKGSDQLEGDPPIDKKRASGIFFVSGEPGSGKTTLYLTLSAMLSKSDNVAEEYSKGYVADLSNLRRSVRLLEPLDLEVAGDEGENLLAAVLVRLFRALDETNSGFSNSALTSGCEEALKELEALATDIGIAWEGNLKARAGALDPDTYSEEVMRTQRVRLGVNERLRNALGKLANKQCGGCRKETLFVLPVDDFYLKPNASLQLLRLLRMISIPRLFFLVMGDITTVEALFIEKSLADWTAVAGTQLFPDKSERLSQALTRARELRARYLRKLLPPGQRATIEPMDWYEALDIDVGSPDSGTTETLGDLLEQVALDHPVHKNSTTETLLQFLISPPFSSEEKDQREHGAIGHPTAQASKKDSLVSQMRMKARGAYSALQILDATPREMMDLGSALREVRRKQNVAHEVYKIGDEDAPPLLSCVKDIVNLVRDEQNFFNEDEQKVLEAVLPTRHYFLEDIHFKLDRLCLQPDPWPWRKPIPGRLWVRKQRSWNLTVNDESASSSASTCSRAAKNQDANEGGTNNILLRIVLEDNSDREEQSPFNNLPPRPTAWIILLHDLAWRWNTYSVTGNLVMRLCRTLKLSQPANDIQIDLPNNILGWAVCRKESTIEHFPMPDFETFQHCDRFLCLWNSGLEWLDDKQSVESEEQPPISEYIRLWEIAGWVVINDHYDSFADAGADRFELKQIASFKKDRTVTAHNDGWKRKIDELRKVVPDATTANKGSKASRP
jgi:RecA/RadA recombinase